MRAGDILHTGEEAFSAALNTVNIGKFNLCFCGIGLATHAFYEAITHAHTRILYGSPVTDFPHIRRQFVDAYARLMGMRLFSDRAVDYFRSAGPDDRRYLLYNPTTKMKVTTFRCRARLRKPVSAFSASRQVTAEGCCGAAITGAYTSSP